MYKEDSLLLPGTNGGRKMADSSSRNVSKTPTEHFQDEKPQWIDDFLEKPYFKPCLLHDNIADNPGLSIINKFCVDCKTPVCPKCILDFGHGTHGIIQVYRHVYQDAVSVKAIKSFMNINDIQTYKCNQFLVVALRPLLSISKINKQVDGQHTTMKLANPDNSSNKPSCTKIIISEQVTSSPNKKNNQSERICQVCDRRLVPMHKFSYCSIQCKLTDYMNKSDHSLSPFLMPGTESMGEGSTNVKIHEKESNAMIEYENILEIKENKSITEIVADQNNVKLEETDRQILRRRKRKGIPHRAPFF